MTSEAVQAARRSQSAQQPTAASDCIGTPTRAGSFRSSEGEASNVPMHQPPDREDDKDQPEYAADPDGSALTVIAAAVEPEPASKEN